MYILGRRKKYLLKAYDHTKYLPLSSAPCMSDEAFFGWILFFSSVLDSFVLLLSDCIPKASASGAVVYFLSCAMKFPSLQMCSSSLCTTLKCFIMLGLRFTTFSQYGHVYVIFSWTVL